MHGVTTDTSLEAVEFAVHNRGLTRVHGVSMSETISIEVPRRGVGSDLTEALAVHGMDAEIVEDGEACSLRVSFADNEHDRLVAEARRAIEGYLAEKLLPLVVQPGNGGVVVRPPGD
jgi:hypothetical protein